MNFLNAKTVALKRIWDKKEEVIKLFSGDEYSQEVFLDMSKEDAPEHLEICMHFDEKHPSPKKLSISAIQYAMDPLELELSLAMKKKKNPYKKVIMGELKTVTKVDANTRYILITCHKKSCIGKSANIKLSVNYVEF